MRNALLVAERSPINVLQDFVKKVCADYSSSKRTRATRYRDWLKDALLDAQLRGKYFDG